MRITRRDFMKYCAISAGALGLTASDLGKIEKALSTEYADGGTHVVWLNGQPAPVVQYLWQIRLMLTQYKVC
jgi:Ni,Fe-hydrogenase I small subunit